MINIKIQSALNTKFEMQFDASRFYRLPTKAKLNRLNFLRMQRVAITHGTTKLPQNITRFQFSRAAAKARSVLRVVWERKPTSVPPPFRVERG